MEQKNQLSLQSLLQFAIKHTKSEDANNSSVYKEINEEKKNFLECALRTMTVDVMEELEKAVRALENPSSVTMDKVNALNVIRDHIDNIDFANSFVKAGGTQVLLSSLKDEESEVRVTALYVIAEMSQNNPFSQKHFIDAGIIPLLLVYINETEDVASGALYALSSLIRNFVFGLTEFVNNGGIKMLTSLLSTSHSRVFIKVCFLLACISSENCNVRDEFIKSSAVGKLFNQLEPISGFDIKMETLLFALSELSKSDRWKHNVNIEELPLNILNIIVAENQHFPQCEEMVAYANIILRNCTK